MQKMAKMQRIACFRTMLALKHILAACFKNDLSFLNCLANILAVLLMQGVIVTKYSQSFLQYSGII